MVKKDTRKTPKKFIHLSERDSKTLRWYLGKGFFQDFLLRYKKKYGKKANVSYPHMNNVLNGMYLNPKILSVLKEMADENKELVDSIKELSEGKDAE